MSDEHLRVLRRRDVFAGVHDEPAVERLHELGELLRTGARSERLEHRRLDDAVEHLLLAAFVDGLELDLARGARDERFEVAHAWHHFAFRRGAATRRVAFATSVS